MFIEKKLSASPWGSRRHRRWRRRGWRRRLPLGRGTWLYLAAAVVLVGAGGVLLLAAF